MKAYQVLGLMTALLAAPVFSSGLMAAAASSEPMLFQLLPPPPPPPRVQPSGSLLVPSLSPMATHPVVHSAPHYPGMSIYLGEHGTVVLWIQVQPDGTPTDIKVESSSGFHRLDRAALDAVQSWKFPSNGGIHPGQPWHVRLPLMFAAVAKMADQPGYWGRDYQNPRYVRATSPFPFPDVASAYGAIAARYGQKSNSNMAVYPIRDAKGVPLELWIFLDLHSTHAIALHFTRGGSLAAPFVAMSARCSDGAAMCAQRMNTLLQGPSFARDNSKEKMAPQLPASNQQH